MPSASPVLSNPSPPAGSAGNSAVARMATPVRSLTDRSYSVFESLRGGTNPGSPAFFFASTSRIASIPLTSASRSSSVGCGLPAGGICPLRTNSMTSCQRRKSPATSWSRARSAEIQVSPCCFALWQVWQYFFSRRPRLDPDRRRLATSPGMPGRAPPGNQRTEQRFVVRKFTISVSDKGSGPARFRQWPSDDFSSSRCGTGKSPWESLSAGWRQLGPGWAPKWVGGSKERISALSQRRNGNPHLSMMRGCDSRHLVAELATVPCPPPSELWRVPLHSIRRLLPCRSLVICFVRPSRYDGRCSMALLEACVLRFLCDERNSRGGVTRREWLRLGGLAGLGAIAGSSRGAESGTHVPGFGRAKSVLLLFTGGGVSQLEHVRSQAGCSRRDSGGEFRHASDSGRRACPFHGAIPFRLARPLRSLRRHSQHVA